MSGYDLSLGAKVMAGVSNWQDAGLLTSLAVLLFGRSEQHDHLSARVTLRWWRGEPYLTGIREG